MKSIKSLENQRWFIWTIVAIVVILGGLATYIYYGGQTDDWGASTNLVIHKTSSHYFPFTSSEQTTSIDGLNSRTPGWKTLTHSLPGYSISYPDGKNAVITNLGPSSSPILTIEWTSATSSSYHDSDIQINTMQFTEKGPYENSPPVNSADEYIMELKAEVGKHASITTMQDIAIDGMKGLVTFSQTGQNVNVTLSSDGQAACPANTIFNISFANFGYGNPNPYPPFWQDSLNTFHCIK